MFKRIKEWLLQNRTVSQTIAKNSVWLFSGQLIGRLLRALIVIYAARVLGVSSWGAFSYALGVAAFLTVFSDIGVNALLTREAAREPELKTKYLATALAIKLFLLAALVVGVLLSFRHLTNIPEAAAVMPILIFVFAFDTLRDLGSAIARSLEKMEIEAGIGIFTNAAIVVLGFLFLTASRTTTSLAYAYSLGSGLGLMAMLYVLRTHFQGLARNVTKSLIKPILATAWPFGLLGIMGVVNLNTDIIMLGWMTSAKDVGYYAAAQKLIQLLYVPPALLATSIFPIMSRLAARGGEGAKALLEKSLALSIAAAVPIAVMGMLLASPIIGVLFGEEYRPATLTFQILLLTIFIVYPSVIVGNAIFAYDRARSFVFFAAAAILGNVAFNALLIPLWGIEGAAISTVLAQLVTNILIWRKMKSINRFKVYPALLRLLKRT